ncbi:unnamed protein product [Knipowitschia caucasica]
MQRWPALFTQEQICMEFKRIVGMDLRGDFYSALDLHTPRLLEIFKTKRGYVGEQLAQLLTQMQSMNLPEKRVVVLKGLPLLLGDSPNEFFKSSFDGDESNGHLEIGILLVKYNGVHLDDSPPESGPPASLKIIIEGEVVIENLRNLPGAVCLLFGLTYGLHLTYPKKLGNTLQCIQQIFFTLGSAELKPRFQTLKNQLLT